MARTATTLQQHEIEAFQKFALERGIKLDGEEGVRNGSVLGGAIISADQDITPASLAAAFEQVRDQLTLKSAAEREYDSVVAANPVAAQQFATWFENQKLLVNTGNEGFQNASGILRELRGREITNQTITAAIASIGAPASRFHAARRQLHFVPSKPIENPKNHALRPEEPKPTSQVKYVHGRKNHATDPASYPTTETTKPSVAPSAWETISKNLLGSGNSHGRNQALQDLFDRGVGGTLPWTAVYQEMTQLKKSWSRVL
jgi:hypothetical protein